VEKVGFEPGVKGCGSNGCWQAVSGEDVKDYKLHEKMNRHRAGEADEMNPESDWEPAALNGKLFVKNDQQNLMIDSVKSRTKVHTL